MRSPLHRLLWSDICDPRDWTARVPSDSAAIDQVMRDAREQLLLARAERRLHDGNGKLDATLLARLAETGYWGALVPRDYGGAGGELDSLAPHLTRLAAVDPTTSGLLAVHSCIGPVNQLRWFGDDDQRQRWLPLLARGERIGVFGLTEPNAGSDLTALRTTAVRTGNEYRVTGEKLFLTNLTYGRLIGLVCRIDEQPAVLLIDAPLHETPEFSLVDYGLHSLHHAHNRGCRFNGFRVPLDQRLTAPRDDGLQIPYHGLNRGRVTLCANAAGTLRIMLADLLPWVDYRRTYGRAIGEYQLVLRRLGRLVALIAGCEALAAWAAGLITAGVRGEMEAIIAKTFAADALREAAVELTMRTHGGRAFLVGHRWGDHLHDYLAPSIYEGENELLRLALFKSLVKPRVAQLMGRAEPDEPVDAATPALPAAWHNHIAAWPALREAINRAIITHGPALAEQQLLLVKFARQVSRLTLELAVAVRLEVGEPDALRAAGLRTLIADEEERDQLEVECGHQLLRERWSALEDCAPQPIQRRY